MAIAKVVRKVNVKNQPDDCIYWRTQPYQARLAALEQIRREFHTWKYNVEPRLQRAYSIVQR